MVELTCNTLCGLRKIISGWCDKLKNINKIPGLSESEVLAINNFSSECKDILGTIILHIVSIDKV